MTVDPRNLSSDPPNIFLFLETDPTASWTRTSLQAALDKMRSEASKQANNPNKRLQAQKRLEIVEKLKRDLNDPEKLNDATLQRLALEAKQTISSRNWARLENLDKDITAAVKPIPESLIEQLVKEYADVISEPELRSRIPQVKRPVLPPMLSDVDARQIREALDVLSEESLYTLLRRFINPGLSSTSALTSLVDAVRQLGSQAQKNMNKGAETTAKAELAGIATTKVFASEDTRRQYNTRLQYERLEHEISRYKRVCSGTHHISETQVDVYLQVARNKQVPHDLAYTFLADMAYKNHYTIAPQPSPGTSTSRVPPSPQSAPPPPPPTQRCGSPICGAENDATRVACKCGEPLRVGCPNCGRGDVPADEGACPSCAFRLGYRFQVKDLLTAGRRELARDQLVKARINVGDAYDLWQPKHADELARSIAGLKHDIDTRQQELDKLAKQERERQERERQAERVALQGKLAELDRLIGMRHFYAAQPLADALPTSTPERVRFHATIRDALTRARHFLDEAKQSGDAERQRDLCRQALDTCADFTEAREYRDNLPKPLPEAPVHLSVSVSERTAHLAWNASPTIGAGYVVVRKTGAPPVSTSDGIRVYAGSALAYDDRIDSGVFTYYAVYAERDGVVSRTGTEAVALFAAEVSDVACRAGDGVVELTWRTPRHVERVEIVRKAGAPPRARHDTSAQAITPTGANTLVDRDVRNGTEYFYALYCSYLDDHGHRHYSQGKIVSATPEAPPASVPHLNISARAMLLYPGQCKLLFAAAAPARGDLVVLKCDQPPQLPSALPADRLSQYGRVLPLASIHVLEVPGTYWYVPVIRDQGMAYPGTPERYEWTGGSAT